ncbi:hypothetical protein apy_10910 [Aeropyrum pernix]|uniref:HTH arsR-type domain-containing protein n=2 Tax=Aeropyrum pernix TaxID=56636 RepID=A0A401HA75_AERPX|nr:hypothetical protein apy_10910 [Aeropyrum pernix]
MYQNDAKIRILLYLADLERPASIRKIARNVGMSHKNVIKHLDELKNVGLVEVAYKQSNLTLYKITDNIRLWVLSFIRCRFPNLLATDSESG